MFNRKFIFVDGPFSMLVYRSVTRATHNLDVNTFISWRGIGGIKIEESTSGPSTGECPSYSSQLSHEKKTFLLSILMVGL